MTHRQVSHFKAGEHRLTTLQRAATIPNQDTSPRPPAAQVRARLYFMAPCRQQGCVSSRRQTYSCEELRRQQTRQSCNTALEELAKQKLLHPARAAHAWQSRPTGEVLLPWRGNNQLPQYLPYLSCQRRGLWDNWAFKIQYFLLLSLATASYLHFFLFKENTSFLKSSEHEKIQFIVFHISEEGSKPRFY